MKYLTYHRDRRRQWTEHESYPSGAIKYWRESRRHQTAPLFIYEMSEDRSTIRLVETVAL